MTTDASAEVNSPEPDARARALIERGISLTDSGEHDAGLADFQEAEQIAMKAGLDGLIAASLINQGYAYTLRDDAGSATRCYEEAAKLTRTAGDTQRLTLALANLSVGLRAQGRHQDATTVLTEYLELVGDQDASARGRGYVSRAMSHADLDDYEQAVADLGEAETAAVVADDPSLLHLVRMNRANVYVRIGDLGAARIVLEQALDAAQVAGDPLELQDALLSLAQVCRLSGLAVQADDLFTSVEREYRRYKNTTGLADALYWHGLVLRSMRRNQSALAKWREEEVIRRQHGQDGHLAECLYAQADALRAERDHETAEPLFREACGLFEKLDMTAILPSALYWHGMSLRAAGDSSEALRRAEEALQLATANGDLGVERRAQSLRAMALADVGEIAAAEEALDVAEVLCEQTQTHSAMVWTLARRAYVTARNRGEAQDVVEWLRRAHEHALSHGEFAAGRAAVRRIAAEIASHSEDDYAESLEAFRREQLEETELIMNGGMPIQQNTASLPAEREAPSASPAKEDDLDESSEEE